MKIKINREQPFQVLATNFSIGPSSSGYDLQISADGVNYTTLFSVGANVTRMVTGVANGSYYKLAGNTDEDVIVNWFRQCDDGQGGGGGGTGSQGPMGPQGPQGPSNSGYKISLSTHSYENYTQEDIAAVNAFLAAVSADSATLNGAYVVVGGQDVFYLSSYDENGFMLFGDTNNGFIHSISWNFDPETAEITGGEYVVNTIPEGGGNEPAFGLKAVEALGTNWDNPETGDIQAKYLAVGNEVVVEGEEFDDGIDLTGKNVSYIYVDDANGVEFSAEGGRWSISWANEEFSLNLIDGEDNITGVYTIETKGDSEDGWDINIQDGDENLMWNMFIDKVYEINDYGFGSDYTVPAGTEGNVNYTYTDYHNEVDGLWRYEAGTHRIAAFSNFASGETSGDMHLGFTYYGRIEDIDSNGVVIFNAKRRYQTAGNYIKMMPNRTIEVRSGDGNDTLIATVYPGSTYDIATSSRHIWIWNDLVEHQYIGISKLADMEWVSLYSGFTTDTPGWVRIDLPEPKPWWNAPGDVYNIPRINSYGQVVAYQGYSLRNMKINTTGNTAASFVCIGGSGLPDRAFFATEVGTEGQVLTSTGNGAPAWATLIKAVQITSADYDALVQAGTTDPNTLYLIVDE